MRNAWVCRHWATAALLVALGCSHTGDSPMPRPREVPPAGPGFELALLQSVGVKFHAGSKVQLVYNGDIFEQLEHEISTAHSSVNIVLYIWRPGEPSTRILAALAERTAHGVACRVIVDPVGSTPAFQREVRPQLLAAHCDVREFRPLQHHKAVGISLARNHRKIVIVDGKVAFTGGFGIYKDWLGHGEKPDEWRDTAVRMEGPVVEDAQIAFSENWQEAGGILLPASDFQPVEAGGIRAAFVASSVEVGPSNADRMTQLAIDSAKHRLWISNAYFVPPDAVLELLERRVRHGVDVRVLTTGPIHDVPEIRGAQRAGYRALIKAGVHVYEYQPAMMHAKTMVVDDQMVMVGSINMDPLSLNQLEEASMLAEDRGLNGELAGKFEEDLGRAKEMNLQSSELPGFWARITRGLFRWVGAAPGR